MREIKFRAWNEEEKAMYSHEMIDKSDKDGIILWGELMNGEDKEFILEQYTGLKDKNGVEIYDGDIVKLEEWNPSIVEVVFDRGGFCFRHSVDDVYYSDAKYLEDGIVIGNIHQNPELLK